MRTAHGARAPWYSLHNYYRVGSRGGEGSRGGRMMGVGRGGISYLFLTGIQDGESRPKDFCVTCRPLPCARHSREMDLLSSPKRGEESIRGGSRAAWYAETRPWRAYGRVKGCGISPPSPNRHSIFPSAVYSPREPPPCMELIMKFLGADLATRNMISTIWEFVQDEFGTAEEISEICVRWYKFFAL